MYSKIEFGEELKKRVANKQDRSKIGIWVFEIYWQYIQQIDDDDFDKILLTLNTMELGPEFYFSYDRLNEIADELISGKDVSLDY